MKKLVLLTLINLFCVKNNLYSQTSISLPVIKHVNDLKSFRDISGSFDHNRREDIAKILAKYKNNYNPSAPSIDIKSVLEEFKKNPYIKIYIKDDFIENSDQFGNSRISITDNVPAVSLVSANLPFVSSIADGIAKFLVSRSKEELKVAFFDKLLNKINENDLDVFFPDAVSTLESIGDEIYNYRTFIPSLQSSFDNDLKLLPNHLGSYIRTLPIDKVAQDKKNLIADFLDIGQLIINREEIHSILNTIGQLSRQELNSAGAMSANIKEIRNSMILLGILSNSLLEDKASRTYIDLGEFGDIIEDEFRTNLYLGLVWEILKNNKVKIGGSLVSDILTTNADVNTTLENKANFLITLRNVIDQGELINEFVTRLNEPSLGKNSVERTSLHYGIVNSIFNASKSILDFAKIDKNSGVIKGVKAFEASVKLPIDIRRQNYNGAIINANEILELALEGSNNKISKKLMRYGGFIAAVASSESSDEISSVIEAYALPVGSYIQKRKASSMNIAFNGYVGIYGAKETLNIDDLQNAMLLANMELTKYSAGITAPLGIAFSLSILNKSSLTLFPSILDLGAVVSFRFEDSITENLPEFSLQNIIAPGVQASIGIGGTPLVISGGWQNGPLLRKIDTLIEGIDENMQPITNQVIETVDASRWFINLSVDIPLFSLRVGH